MNGVGRGKAMGESSRTLRRMSTAETSRFVRLRVELVLEIEDSDALAGSALQRIADDVARRDRDRDRDQDGDGDGDGEGAHGGQGMMDEDRAQAEIAVQEDDAEALAYLVDPFDLVSAVPGVGLAQASWSCEEIDYDPDSPDGGLGEDDDAEDADGDAR